MRLQGKVAVITGATRGMGAEMARRFAVEGARVVLAGRDKDKGQAVADAISGDGGEALFVATDISIEQDVRTLMSRAVDAFGGVDVLVNNAAATRFISAGGDRPVADLDTADFDTILKVGLYGSFWCCKYAIPFMIGRGGGSIVNISSTASTVGLPGVPAYTVAKGGINSLTRQIAFDYSPHNIRCNTIVSGMIINDWMRDAVPTPEVEASFRALQFTRLGRDEDIANVAVYLASEDSGFVSGSLLTIDGGASARGSIPTVAVLAATAGT